MTRAKGRRWLWALAIAGVLYVFSFLALRYYLLPDHELRFPQRHPLRPAYAVIYYPLRLLAANRWSLVPPEVRGFVGKVAEITNDKIVVDGLHIGFVCSAEACQELARVKRGDEVEAIFGVALTSDRDGFINKLVSVRRCAPGDPQCASTRQAQRLKDEEENRAVEASEKQFQLCIAAMEETLQRDGRYVRPLSDQEPSDQALRDKFYSLTGFKRTCRDSIVENHHQAVFDSCTRHRCGDNVGGGCSHLFGQRRIHSGVIAKAVDKCGT